MITVFSELKHQLIIASSFTNDTVLTAIKKYSNIKFVDINSQEIMSELFENAHINTLITYQKTGIKLKLINTLHKSRFVIANDKMIDDTGLENLCLKVNTNEDFIKAINKLMETDFQEENKKQREVLLKDFNPLQSAQKIIDILF